MNKAFDKILERLSNIHRVVKTDEDAEWNRAIYKSTEIVQEVAGEYNDGWIPCSNRLPDDGIEVLVWFEYYRYGEYNRLYQTVGISFTYNGEWSGFVNGSSGYRDLRIIAWQPLPEPYKESE